MEEQARRAPVRQRAFACLVGPRLRMPAPEVADRETVVNCRASWIGTPTDDAETDWVSRRVVLTQGMLAFGKDPMSDVAEFLIPLHEIESVSPGPPTETEAVTGLQSISRASSIYAITRAKSFSRTRSLGKGAMHEFALMFHFRTRRGGFNANRLFTVRFNSQSKTQDAVSAAAEKGFTQIKSTLNHQRLHANQVDSQSSENKTRQLLNTQLPLVGPHASQLLHAHEHTRQDAPAYTQHAHTEKETRQLPPMQTPKTIGDLSTSQQRAPSVPGRVPSVLRRAPSALGGFPQDECKQWTYAVMEGVRRARQARLLRVAKGESSAFLSFSL